MLQQAGAAEGMNVHDPRPLWMQSCLQAHLLILAEAVAEMTPAQRNATTETQREAPVPQGVYYPSRELVGALLAIGVRLRPRMRRADLSALAPRYHLISEADEATRFGGYYHGAPPPDVVAQPQPTMANGRVLAVAKAHKLALASVLPDTDTPGIIEDAVQRMNLLWGHGMPRRTITRCTVWRRGGSCRR
ncbi:hypothetical protein CDCA_CDCA14G3879 [Cyanidium caldarium]|uniref:Uncharacterized protein n=1 Tax=Cyanidium caldarium TaxID=2771 RepID=A0AAV9J016_CYACA|nr:hypothetical protein CDCA_CDCA14G3879 [Cyanidium caldarium]